MTGKTEVLAEKPVPDPLSLPEIPHRLASDLTRASAVGVGGWVVVEVGVGVGKA
jgi:hypothetical protein